MRRPGDGLDLMATTYDVSRIRAVVSVDFDRDALFAATICVETFQRRSARLLIQTWIARRNLAGHSGLAASGTTMRKCCMWKD
jgi:hypothetical protein